MEIIKDTNKVYILDEEGKEIAICEFPSTGENEVTITTTRVDDCLRGQGIASKLVMAAYEVIKSQNLKAKLKCSYAIAWFDKHPEYKDIL